jgi:hypothetical protein
MTPELWGPLAAFCVTVAILASGLALFRPGGRWTFVVVGARVGAVAVLVAAVLTAVGVGPSWSPFDLRQLAQALALATLVVYLGLVWRLGVDAAAPVVDLAVLALLLVGLFAGQSSRSLLPCILSAAPFRAQWTLFLLGAGGAAVAGSAGIMLAFRSGLSRRDVSLRWPRWIDLHACLRHATLLTLVALGSGLAVGAWWAWRMSGSLTSGDAREAWMAVAWLIAAMSLLARRTGRRWQIWTAGLAVGAAAVAVLGLLAAMHLGTALGT